MLFPSYVRETFWELFISDSLLIVRPGDSIKLLHFEQRWRQH